MGIWQSVTRFRRANAVEWIEVLFGVETLWEQRNIKTYVPIPPRIRRGLRYITLATCAPVMQAKQTLLRNYF